MVSPKFDVCLTNTEPKCTWENKINIKFGSFQILESDRMIFFD